VRFKSAWYCSFRESRDHMGGGGRIRVLRSRDGRSWESNALLAQRGIDLRDPKLSVTPASGLMLLAGGTRIVDGKSVGRRPRVAFCADGSRWSRLEPILDEGDWLWRVTWHERRAYGVTYRLLSARRWTVSLLSSSDGLDYREICDLGVDGRPNEATVRFLSGGEAVALVRREGGDKRGWVGSSPPPYERWRWTPLDYRLGGPNFIVLSDGRMWAASRIIRGKEAALGVGPLTADGFAPHLFPPSGGDCGYPGMVEYRGQVWISYYSSHEGKASIYLARLPLTSR